jgi:exonuclease III
VFLQEVAEGTMEKIRGHTIIANVGTENRGTALVVKDHLRLQKLTRLPSGRGIAADLTGIRIVNIYAPSGAERRREREAFFTEEIPILLQNATAKAIIGGDFNCVLNQSDTTGKSVYSGALQRLVTGYGLVEVWNAKPDCTGYTHFTRMGASRIDRLYVTWNLLENKSSMAVLPLAITDHLAVVLRIRWGNPIATRGRGYWKLNISLLDNPEIRDRLRESWNSWKRNSNWYGDITQWWSRSAKKQLRRFFMNVGAEKKRDAREMENHCYQCISDILQSPVGRQDRFADLNRFKAKIVKIHSERTQGAIRGMEGTEIWTEERISIHHIIRQKKRMEQRTVTAIRTANGHIAQSTQEILSAFWEELRQKYQAIPIEKEMMRELLSVEHNRLDDQDRRVLDAPLTVEEIERATRKGGENKAPGPDGIGEALFTRLWGVLSNDWADIFRTMFNKKSLTEQQQQGVVVCIPKTKHPMVTHDYRNITLLNSDYKIMARILAARLKAVIGDRLHPDQYCGVANRTILDAAATLRDVIALSEITGKPACVLSLDLTEAFNRVAHEYLFTVL